MVSDWYSTTIEGLQNFWKSILAFFPNLIGAIIVFLIGWAISVGIGKLISTLLQKLRIDRLLQAKGLKEALEKAEIKVKPSEFIGAICKWILIIVFLMAAVDILGWTGFRDVLRGVINYLPNVLVAVLIFVVMVIVADIVEKLVIGVAGGMKVKYATFAGAISKWAIWVFGVLAILQQLKFQAANWIFDLIKIAFLGFVVMLAIAFGLGGKEIAAEILGDLRKKFKKE
jgi:hypothetical protein